MGVEEGNLGDDYTEDGTVDLKGNPVLRSKRGGWKACSFIVGISLVLSLSYRFNFSSKLLLDLALIKNLPLESSREITSYQQCVLPCQLGSSRSGFELLQRCFVSHTRKFSHFYQINSQEVEDETIDNYLEFFCFLFIWCNLMECILSYLLIMVGS